MAVYEHPVGIVVDFVTVFGAELGRERRLFGLRNCPDQSL